MIKAMGNLDHLVDKAADGISSELRYFRACQIVFDEKNELTC